MWSANGCVCVWVTPTSNGPMALTKPDTTFTWRPDLMDYPGNQNISRHGIDLFSPKIASTAQKGLIHLCHLQWLDI